MYDLFNAETKYTTVYKAKKNCFKAKRKWRIEQKMKKKVF